jgi:SulP family sulfate permease
MTAFIQVLNRFKVPGDLWGGFASMLVALPASVGFGVTVYSAISPQYAVFGALAGILGATALGLIAPTFGGTDRLISAPCAPAAAVLSAFAIEMVQQGAAPASIVLLLTVMGMLTGMVQMGIGFMGAGRLIKYIPYTVVSGYLSGVGLIIVGSQIPHFVGASPEQHWWQALTRPDSWDGRSLVVGGATVGAAFLALRGKRTIPATIVGIACGTLAYVLLARNDPSMRTLTDNPLVLGALGATGEGYLQTITSRWTDIGELRLSQITALLGSALTLAALLSIDTLKTCVVIDQMTRTRHEPNRELLAQGLANIASSAVGGMPGAGTMGATMVNLSSGAQTRVSGVIEGVLVLLAALVLSPFVAWVPVATLAGILIVVGLRMIDTRPLRFLESRATVFDFAVVLVVIACALTVGLIAASVSGVALSILLFVREQVGGTVVRHKTFVSQRSSTWYRPEDETRLITQEGDKAVIFELQGSLFFGTTYELFTLLEPELKTRDYVILDMRRVQSVDITAAQMLNNARDLLRERGKRLLLSHVREQLPNGRNLREFLCQTGLIEPEHAPLTLASAGAKAVESQATVRVFKDLPAAIEWVEDQIVAQIERPRDNQAALTLQDMEMFKDHRDDTIADLEASLQQRAFRAGETIYAIGDQVPELFLIRRGEVRITAPIAASRQVHHIATYGRGDFFGGMSFLDEHVRSENAIAQTDIELFALPLEQYVRLSENHKKLSLLLMTAISRTLAQRLRHADGERTLLHA